MALTIQCSVAMRCSLVCAVLLLVACSGTSSPGDGGVNKDGGADSGNGLVPAEPFVGDVMACPENYRASKPAAGQNDSYVVAGQARDFFLGLPDANAYSGPRPVLFGFNGTYGSGDQYYTGTQLAIAVARGFIVIAPSSNANGTIWPVWDGQRNAGDTSPNPDLEYFDSLLSCMAAHYEVDKNRIYATGHSAGGIMTNFILRKRANIMAGGIPQSGLISLTGEPSDPDLDPLFVIVAWGGDDDMWGGTVEGTTVPSVNFATEAVETSIFYSAQPNVGHAYCRIKEGSAFSGHVPLPITEYLVARLLEHPKGVSGAAGVTLPEGDPHAEVTCGVETLSHGETTQVTCDASTQVGCQESCQLIADCGVENDLVFDALTSALAAIGFTRTTCGGCTDNCELNSAGANDSTVLDCLKTAQAGAVCGQGLTGALPLINGVNSCCAGQDSQWCDFLCTEIAKSPIALTQFTVCQ